jgi:hypothetical protein
LFGRKQPRSEAEIRAIREEAQRRREEREAEENPGELVTLPSGIQYRELDEGRVDGKVAAKGDTLYILYTVYRLAPGAYFKYSSGGTPIFLWSRGYGNEGQDDVGDPYRFVLGESDSVPEGGGARVGGDEGGRATARAGAAAARVDEWHGTAQAWDVRRGSEAREPQVRSRSCSKRTWLGSGRATSR